MGKYNEDLVQGWHHARRRRPAAQQQGRARALLGRAAHRHGRSVRRDKELIAGFWLWQVKSKEEAIEWAKRCPNPMPGTEAEIEIRQVFEAEDFGAELTPELREQEERLRAQADKLRAEALTRKGDQQWLRIPCGFTACCVHRPKESIGRSSTPVQWPNGCRRNGFHRQGSPSGRQGPRHLQMSFTNFTTGHSHSSAASTSSSCPMSASATRTSSTTRTCPAKCRRPCL